MLTIVLPVFNESNTIIHSIERINSELLLLEYEIIIVDDGSTDNSIEVINHFIKDQPHVQLISYIPNRGKGYALKTGFNAAHYPFVIFLDSDLDILSNNLPRIIEQINDYDLIISSKWMKNSQVDIPLQRKLLSKFFNLIVRNLTGIKYHDTQVGLKILRKSAFVSFIRSSKIDRFAFDVELVLYAQKNALTILEVPVEISINSASIKLHDIFDMLLDVIRIAYF